MCVSVWKITKRNIIQCCSQIAADLENRFLSQLDLRLHLFDIENEIGLGHN